MNSYKIGCFAKVILLDLQRANAVLLVHYIQINQNNFVFVSVQIETSKHCFL